jgi:predicted Zn-dependent protease
MIDRLRVLLLTVVLALASATPAFAYTQAEQQELQIGQQVYAQYVKQGKIVTSSPYYAVLNPIAHRIESIANAKYFTPFQFVLYNDSQPNAFAVPGGIVYVTTGMMTFAQNREELAGVLCHETSHDIHHDVMNLNPKYQTIGTIGGILSALLGNSQLADLAINVAANAQANSYSRHAESSADQTGAMTCAQAGINPWGMVWLMKRFETKPSGVPMEFLSDHPRDDHRVSDLETLFRDNPATFGRFSSNPSAATPLR